MNRPRDWLPRLLLESGVVVVSILAALAADAWWEERETRAAVDTSLESIRAEISGNLDRLQRVAPYHRNLADTLLALRAAGFDQVNPDIYSQGWLITPQLTAAAWEGARATGTTAGIISDVASWERLLMAQYERVMEEWPGQGGAAR